MINDLLKSVSTIYIAYGVTDFRKQIHSLCDIVQSKYKLNPYKKEAFIHKNRDHAFHISMKHMISVF